MPQGRVSIIDLMNKLANPTMKVVLRSPLHGLVSNGVMLITVSGRRSGRQYTTPVNYVREGNTLTVFSRRNRSWWRNLRGGAPVTTRVRGRELTGFGEVDAADSEAIAAALLAARPSLSPEKAALLAQDGVLVRIRLDERPG